MADGVDREQALALFQTTYQQFYPSVYAFFLGRTGDANVALELVQDVFTRVWQRIDSLKVRDVEERRYWIFAVSRNRLTDYYRKKSSQSRRESPLPAADDASLAVEEDLDRQLMRTDTMRALQSAVAALPELLQTIVTMRYVGGMTSKEISILLDMPAGTVRYQLSMAVRQLRQSFEILDPRERGSAQ